MRGEITCGFRDGSDRTVLQRPPPPIVACTETLASRSHPVAVGCVELIVVREGSGQLIGEFGYQPLSVGDVIVVAADTWNWTRPEGSITTTTLYLDADYLVDQVFWEYADFFTDRLHAKHYLEVRFAHSTYVTHLPDRSVRFVEPFLNELVLMSSQGLLERRFHRAQALLSTIFDAFWRHTDLLDRHAEVPFGRTRDRPRRSYALRYEARTAAAMLQENYCERWSVAALAAAVHMSVSQFSRVFARSFGKSPISYLTMIRVEKMAHLLRETETPVSAIASQVGWADTSFAIRQFRLHVGVTPQRYREFQRRSQPPKPIW